MIKRLKRHLALRKAFKAEKKLHKALKKEARILANRTDTEYDKPVLTWTAPEFIRYKKGWLWYVIFVLVFGGGTVLAYIYSSWSFALVLLAFAVAYLLLERRYPKRIKIIISEMGIKVGNSIYQYNRIRAFWIIYNPPLTKTLYIKVHNEFLVDIEIQLDGQSPVDVQEFLLRKIPELEGKEEGFLKHLTRLFRL